jgi:acyl dehydratase
MSEEPAAGQNPGSPSSSPLRDWYRERVGQEIEVSDWLTVSQDMIDRFADLTGDHQWIHVDPERAASESPFGGTIAHGALVLSLATSLLDFLPKHLPVSRGVNYGADRLRFTHPVPAGARIRGRRTVIAADPLPEGGVKVTGSVTIELEGVDKPACTFEAIILLFP